MMSILLWIASGVAVILLVLGVIGYVTVKRETMGGADGEFNVTTRRVKSTPQVITPASVESLARFETYLRHADVFLHKYLSECAQPTLLDYDEAFKRWQRDAHRTHLDAQVIHYLGAVLGQRMVDDLDMEWVRVEDRHGIDDAVQSRQYKIVAYPFSSVAKRIENDECDFLDPIYRLNRTMIESGTYDRRDDAA